MSAVERYRKYMAERKSMLRSNAETLADDAIAELEAENETIHALVALQRERTVQAEAKVEHLHEVLEQNKAELAALTEAARKRHNDWCALKARRCETCLECQTHLGLTKMEYRTCGMSRNPCEDEALPACFCCSEWQERGK